MGGKMVIKIQGELPDLNTYINKTRTNKYVSAKIKKEACELVAWQLKGKEKIEYPSEFHFEWIVKNRKKDPDNIAFAVKFILDAMQDVGMLENDSMDWIQAIHHTYSVGEPGVIITIDG